MAFTVPVENYVRSPYPSLPESKERYIQEELKKLERTLGTVSGALRDVDSLNVDLQAGSGFNSEVSLASAATTDIGAVASLFVQLTGTTTITSFGETYSGPRFLRFEGSLTLTNGAGLVLPGGANIVTSAGDTCIVTPMTGGWVVSNYKRASGTSLIGALTGSAAIASTSGTSIDFTSIPSWVKRITISFSGVSTNGTSLPLVQLGGGSVDATGYTGTVWSISGVTGSNLSTGFSLLAAMGAAVVFQGLLTLVLTDAATNTWTATSQMGLTGGSTNVHVMGGTKALSAPLDRVRITTAGGTNTFDAGIVNILYE